MQPSCSCAKPAEQLSLRALARSLGCRRRRPTGTLATRRHCCRPGHPRLPRVAGALRAARRAAGDRAPRSSCAPWPGPTSTTPRATSAVQADVRPLVQPSEKHPELREVSRETLALVQSILEQGMQQRGVPPPGRGLPRQRRLGRYTRRGHAAHRRPGTVSQAYRPASADRSPSTPFSPALSAVAT
jgi:hypothetical protein